MGRKLTSRIVQSYHNTDQVTPSPPLNASTLSPTIIDLHLSLPNPIHSHPQLSFDVAASGKAGLLPIEIKPFCMSFEDYYASFSPCSPSSFSVSPSSGRMDRRGGESTHLVVKCDPQGRSGAITGHLVVVLPEENEKLTYEITANAR